MVLVKIRHLVQIRCGQDIRIENPERGFGFDPRSIDPHRPRIAEQGRFFKEPHSYVRVALRQEVSNLLRVGMKIDENLIDAVAAAYFQPDRKERNTPNGYQTLRDPVRERT